MRGVGRVSYVEREDGSIKYTHTLLLDQDGIVLLRACVRGEIYHACKLKASSPPRREREGGRGKIQS